ncbi:MAG: serpin family protein [Bacteroidota bacterium]|nr:serpin family protein [Bacteroidota bacterium]
MNKIYGKLHIFLMLLLIISCSRAPTQITENEPPRQLNEKETALVNSVNGFSFKILNRINKSELNQNVFISPLSISYALGMTLNGAGGNTYDSIKNTLDLSTLSPDEINQNYKSLMELLVNLDPKVIFKIANSIWHRNDLPVEKDFIDVNKKYFDAQVSGLDFGAPNAAQIINAWVDQNTNGKIKTIVPDPIPNLVVMYLINAIYFKGNWTYQFDPNQTKDDKFTLPGGSQKICKMMSITGDFKYFEDEQLQMIDLPYGDKKFSMTIVLPKGNKNIDQFVSEITEIKWNSWIQNLRIKEGDLFLPKYKIEFKKSLNDVLKAMGMDIAFDHRRANFTNISKIGDLHITNVLHKTYVDVNEEGTEAAAVTSVEIGVTSIQETFVMRVDRPFFFVIRDNHSHSLIFMGKIVEPTL